MQITPRPSTERQTPAYKVTINTSTFNVKRSAEKQRIDRIIIPKYWERFGMDQKKIGGNKEDRLSKLSTQQIDRIIDMEKIRSLLYDKKRKVKERYFEYKQNDPNKHSNVYRAQFLAKINQIAIKRNIRPETQIYDEFAEENALKTKGLLKKQTRTLLVPFMHSKQCIKKQSHPKKVSVSVFDINYDQKSIDEIDDDVQLFERRLQQQKKRGISVNGYRKSMKTQYKLLPSNRWFYGMSTYYLDKGNHPQTPEVPEVFRSKYDIESYMRPSQTHTSARKSFRNTYSSTDRSKEGAQHGKNEAFGQFKISRLVTIE